MRTLWALLLFLPLHAASLFDSSKDQAWTAVRGVAVSDPSVTREGRPSLRVEPGSDKDACVRSRAVGLTIGKTYELRGWGRTEKLAVRELDRSPIAVGAALSMASMPVDVHSESAGGTRNWTRLELRFTATRSEDHIQLTAGQGGAFTGKAWFEGVTLDEISSEGQWPARAALKTFGPAYRYPSGGWIYLHIEGAPYERGYQHGWLMAREIEQYLDRCASQLDSSNRQRAWELGRTSAAALFLRGFDQEILQEMKGIAAGGAAAGAKWAGRELTLEDIVAANTITELGLLRAANAMTPTGLEGLHFERPRYFDPKRDVPVTERCSAFAATGKATRGGKMVIAHITMWPLTLAEQTNIMLDIQPTAGHRVLMQSYPGGIQSGTDYYQNDAGVVLTETTIRQSPFNIEGTPIAYRARKAIQYGTNIDRVVEHLSTRNNGLYTNEWLVGDAKNNEVAMLELGTYKTKLYRSTRDDWFGGTEGFYWGCNNAKDLDVRLEYAPNPKGAPAHLPFVPASRDIKWQELYQEHKGTIDEQFAFLAFRTAPLVSASSMDAKVTNADMASRMMCWAVFGKPNQREWVPNTWERRYDKNAGLYSSGYRLFAAEPSPALKAAIQENEKARLAKTPESPEKKDKKASYKDRLWEGWILPASDADLWLSAGSAAYYNTLRSDDLEQALEAHRTRYRAAALEGDEALLLLRTDLYSSRYYDLAREKGALLLDAFRREMGDEKFLKSMKDFFAAHTTRAVKTQEFVDAAGDSLKPFFAEWLAKPGLPGDKGGALYLTGHLWPRLKSALLVYGTVTDAGANRYAAEQLQKKFLDWFESEVPIRKDFEVSEEELRSHDVIFVGRPETNSALAEWAGRMGLEYTGAVFRIAGKDYASEKEALSFAAPNPLERTRMALVMAGNSALETVRLATGGEFLESAEYAVFSEGKRTKLGFLKLAANERK